MKSASPRLIKPSHTSIASIGVFCGPPGVQPTATLVVSLNARVLGPGTSHDSDEFLATAIGELHRIVDGERLASVSLTSYFAGGVETMEQLEAALDGIRETCAPLISAGKKVIAG